MTKDKRNNPLITLFSDGLYLFKELSNKYSIKQIKQYLEIRDYIEKLKKKKQRSVNNMKIKWKDLRDEEKKIAKLIYRIPEAFFYNERINKYQKLKEVK